MPCPLLAGIVHGLPDRDLGGSGKLPQGSDDCPDLEGDFVPLNQQNVRGYSCHHTGRVESTRTYVKLPVSRVAADSMVVNSWPDTVLGISPYPCSFVNLVRGPTRERKLDVR